MPAARGVKRTASKASASETSAGPKNKKRNVFQLEIPTLPKKRGRVLTCGQGDVGQLGLGEDVIETSKFKHVTGLGEKIVYVCAGGMHTVALDSDGKVWTFGCNDEGALGRATSGETDEGTPKQVSLPLPAVAISAGDSHTAALLNNGDVYAWGSFRDSHGSMGLVMRGREGKPCVSPQHVAISPQQPAAAIASGGDHLVVLTTSGNVYTMGCGEQGQLGRLSQRSATRDTRQGFSPLLQPSKVTIKSTTTKVWAGYHATFALDSNNRLLAWGLNNYGQLGVSGDKRKTALFSPLECDAFSSRSGGGWAQVACGQHHSLALDDEGQVYAIGRCEYGRLGLGDRSGDAESLEPVPKLQNKKCVSIAAGTSNSFAVTENGETYAWGMGSEGQLGTGGSSDAALPTLAASTAMADRNPVMVSAGGQHTVLLAVNPNATRELSPVAEAETAAQTVDTQEEEEETEPEEPVEKKPKGRQAKNKKKQEQEDEVSSTSTVSRRANAQKVNGDEKKGTQMEVDEIDSKEEKKTETDTVAEKNEENKEESEKDKVESMDSSSQDTADSDTPSQTSQEQDVDMEKNATENVEKKEEIPEKNQEVTEKIGDMDKAEVNGTAQDVVESKSLESVSEISATA